MTNAQAPRSTLPLVIGPLIHKDRRVQRYGATVLVVLAVGGFRLALTPIMGSQAPLLPFLLAVLAAAYLSGRGPALFATFLAPALVTPLFTAWPHGTHALAWTAHVVFFLIVGVLLVLIVHKLQVASRAQHAALQAAHEAERALKDAHYALSLALRAGHAGSFDWDIRSNTNVWSEEMLVLHGFKPGEFGGTREAWLECVVPEDRERMLASIEHAIAGGNIAVEYRISRHDNSEVRWMRGRGRVFYDDQRTPLRMLGINSDITERKQAEESLRDQERLLQLIYDNSSDCLFLVQVESPDQFRFISVNETFVRMTGLARSSAEGQVVEAVAPPASLAQERAKYNEVIGSRSPVVYTQTAEHPAGRRHSEITLIPIIAADGAVTHILGAMKDVTAKKHAEDALQAANHRKDAFLAMLAHELRNPLAPIRNVAHILATANVDAATVQRSSELLQRQASQLGRLIDDLLDVARITRDAIELKTEPLFVEHVLETALESVHTLFAVKHQSVNFERAAVPLRIEGDPVRLSQVFANLLANAAKFSPEGTTIHLHAEQSADYAIVRVCDEGIGIAGDMLEHVFEIFAQADRSLDRKQGGLGIGLTIVKSLVEKHGGRVEAFSAGLGRGSEFTVRLPLLSTIENAPRNDSVDAKPTTPSKILIVDDNIDAAESLAMLLKLAGHEVRTAHDGPTAFKLLEQFAAELIFLDIGLPSMDGYRVAETIRERFPAAARRLYALTGYGRDEDRSRAQSAGFDGHLTKPVDPDLLLSLIKDPWAAN